MMVSVPPGPIRKFNPGTFQTDEQVKQQFVVRHAELDILADVLRGNIDSPSCQHVMVVGPRGQGKTMLLARLSCELRQDAELSASLLPVRFMEESLEIFDIADFWLETMFHLVREVARDDPDVAEELRRSREDLLSRRETTLADQALAIILDAATRLSRRLVLMIENMQDLCGETGDDFAWQLRGVLQTEPQIMLVGTATVRFPELQSADKAFFEMFRFLDLKPLDTAACRRLWCAVSGEGAADRTIRPLEILTGGSPRLLVIVAQFARHRSLAELMEELVTVVDEHTEYFRGHLDALAKGERRVYVAVIDLWQPSSTGEIANRARMDVRATSTLLGRLVGKGLVGFEGAGRRRRYVATERLYSIYYKLRRERDEAAIVLNLIRFMAAFYTEREFAGLWDALTGEAQQSPLVHEGLVRALADPTVAAAVSESFRSSMDELARTVVAGQYAEALTMAERLLPRADDDESTLAIRLSQSLAHMGMGDADTALRLYGEIEERFGESAGMGARRMVAGAMFGKVITLAGGGQPRDVVEACRRLIRQFDVDRDDSHIASLMAAAFAYMADALLRLRDLLEALYACNEAHRLLETGGAPQEHTPTAPMLAKVLASIALAHLEQGYSGAALRAWRLVVERYGQTKHGDAQHAVAVALLGQAFVLNEQEALDAAEEYCDDLVARFGRSDTEDLRRDVANALVLKGDIAVDTYRETQGIRIADEIERDFGTLTDYAGLGFAWRARSLKVTALACLGKQEDAVKTLRSAYAVFVPLPGSIQGMTGLVTELVSLGVPAEDLLGVFVEDDERAESLGPLTVALAQECGLEARAPEEVLAVAADIRRDWQRPPEARHG